MSRKNITKIYIYCCCSVTKLCLAFCDPMDCSKSGFSVLNYLLELAQIHVHWVSSANHLILCCPLLLPQSFPASGSFPISQFFASGGQSIEASALASVLSMNIQGWSLLRLTALISLQSKGLSRVFQHHNSNIDSSVLSLLYGSTLTCIHECWKNHSFDYIFKDTYKISPKLIFRFYILPIKMPT